MTTTAPSKSLLDQFITYTSDEKSEQHAKEIARFLAPLLTLLLARKLAAKHLARLTGDLSDAGFAVPVLDREQSSKIMRSFLPLVAIVAFRAAASAQATKRRKD
jgi:hypothetical protein